MQLYAISASTVEKVADGELHRQSHYFLLNANVQGIRDEKDAEAIARRIINPTGNENLTVYATAVKL